MKKVAIIGTVGIPARYGGFETLAHHLVDNLNDEFKLSVYCSSKAYSKKERVKYYNKARLYYLPLNANGAQSIIYDCLSILHALFYADTLVILGVSGGFFLPFVRLFTRKKIITNIDGLEWRRAKWNKWIRRYLKIAERLAVRSSHSDITDNAAIKRYTAKYYKTLSTLIEYGADHVSKIQATDQNIRKYPFLTGRYAFKVARIEPENNIHVILESFEKVDMLLVVVGNWDKSEYGESLKNAYGRSKNILLLDAIYDQVELDVLRSNCYLYVHGHSAGGTNPSLVEAMFLDLPILAYDCTYNRATTEDQCLYFKDSAALNYLVNNIKQSDVHAIANKMGEIARRRYRWRVISRKYASIINSFDFNHKRQAVTSILSKSLNTKRLHQQGMAHLQNPMPYYEELKD